MAKSKKPKKKYTPRTIYFPKIINAMFAFDPLLEALDKLITEGVILRDDAGIYVYRNSVNEEESFSAGLEIYHNVVQRVAAQINIPPIDLDPLQKLKAEMEAQDGFDEETILNASTCLKACKIILSNAPALLVRTETINVGLEREKGREQI